MSVRRYVIAFALALVIHGLALSYAPEKQQIEMGMDSGEVALKIQLLSIAKPAAQAETAPKTETKEPITKPDEPKKPAEKPQLVKNTPVAPAKAEATKPPVSKPAPPQPKPVTKTKPQQTAVAKPTLEPIKPEPLEQESQPSEVAEKAQPEEATTAQVATVDSKPTLLKKVNFSAKPTPVKYPRLARKRGMEGRAMIEVWIGEDGQQVKREVVQSTGHKLLDEAALKAIEQWQFAKRSVDGIAIAHRVHIPINFQLN